MNRFRIRIRFFTAVLTAGLFLYSGCADMKENLHANYVPPSIILPANIKTIAVRPFDNQTSQPDIGNKLWLATTDEFIRDGRIAYVDNESKADGVVIGTIKQYIDTPLSYDVSQVVKEHQLWIVMDLKFLDQTKQQYLWEEPLLDEKFRYFVETEPGGLTTEQAREQLWSRFATDIVTRTLDGFGSVTSSSPKSVPKQQTPDNPPPAYPSTNPF